MTKLTTSQEAILRNVQANPGCTRGDAIDTYLTINGYESTRYAYARVKRCENNGWIEDKSTAMNRSELYITDAGIRALDN